MNSTKTNQRLLLGLLFVLIVAVGVGSRFWFVDWPNFKPVAALCLFAGFAFRRFSLAVAAGVSILMISDYFLGGYPWQIAVAVYSSMAIAAGLGWAIQRRSPQRFGAGLNWQQVGQFLGGSLCMSTIFFVLTNLAVWKFSGWYATSFAGLADCFVAALPFYRWTLMGDLTFTMGIISVYQLVCIAIATPSEDRAFEIG